MVEALLPPPTDYLTTQEAATRWRRHRDTIWDWITSGLETPAGRVRLKAKKVGGRWMTTDEWLEEFFTACGGEDEAAVAEPASVVDKRARREQKAAAKQLGKK